jgi:hypothetical protein
MPTHHENVRSHVWQSLIVRRSILELLPVSASVSINGNNLGTVGGGGWWGFCCFLWHRTTDRVLTADGRYRREADIGGFWRQMARSRLTRLGRRTCNAAVEAILMCWSPYAPSNRRARDKIILWRTHFGTDSSPVFKSDRTTRAHEMAIAMCRTRLRPNSAT